MATLLLSICIDAHLEAAAHLLKGKQKYFLRLHLSEQRETVVTTESKKVGLPRVMKPLESVGHEKPTIFTKDC
jgi:hypothetical protein